MGKAEEGIRSGGSNPWKSQAAFEADKEAREPQRTPQPPQPNGATSRPVIGILGAGKLGTVLAARATASGYRVLIAGSGDPASIRAHLTATIPGVEVESARRVTELADVIMLALPLGALDALPAEQMRNKVVIDAMNHWLEADGPRDDLTDPSTSTSEIVQARLPDSRVVKAFNHMGYHDIDELWAEPGAADRNAIAIAGDDEDANAVVARIVDDFGFDPLPIGRLAEGVKLEPNTVAFGVTEAAAGLRRAIDMFPRTPRGRAVLAARGGRI
ncbi:NAD(P)-binding domain-containing protein [uncultured Agrococcus sp.]|uniref:NADPH-dependent F420 reductase n=1 Tax=uncultured Agrococcus sp. TaxID=382258 RepID=UPI0025DB9AD8|nr:NAD(P)-binding domain-containing protein [uncultured Agrococcus sp.]